MTYDQTFEKLWMDNEPKPIDAGFGHDDDCPYDMVPVPGQPKWPEAPMMAQVSTLDGFDDLVEEDTKSVGAASHAASQGAMSGASSSFPGRGGHPIQSQRPPARPRY